MSFNRTTRKSYSSALEKLKEDFQLNFIEYETEVIFVSFVSENNKKRKEVAMKYCPFGKMIAEYFSKQNVAKIF